MHKSRFTGLLLLVVTGIFFSIASAVGDDANPAPSLTEVHNLLQQAGDAYKADAPPVAAQQTELLNKALKMLAQLPHVYHGQLKAAARSIEAALSEIASGDTAHKAKGDIYDADDAIKSIM